MKKNSWTVAVGVMVSALGLTGCDDVDVAGFNGGKRASAAPRTNIETVVVTWQPRDRVSEYRDAWRPKSSR